MSAYQFIATQTVFYPVNRLCHVLAVATSSYYAWQKSLAVLAADTATATTAKYETWEQALTRIFAAHKGRYGARRLHAEL